MRGLAVPDSRRVGDQTQEQSIWQEWLSLYLDECRRTLRTDELHELALFLREPATGRGKLSKRTAAEGKYLINFLAGVDDPVRRGALMVEAIARLGRSAPRDAV